MKKNKQNSEYYEELSHIPTYAIWESKNERRKKRVRKNI